MRKNYVVFGSNSGRGISNVGAHCHQPIPSTVSENVWRPRDLNWESVA